MRPCPPGWHIARTVDEAIRILADGMHTLIDPVKVVDLDHDIKYLVTVDLKGDGNKTEIEVASPETFQPVARYIALMPPEYRPEVLFHTANPDGERAMRAILETEAVA